MKTIRDLIFYRYAKIIAKRANRRDNYGFIMERFKSLKEGRINWSNLTREHRYAILRGQSCVYCNSPSEIQMDHIIPISKGGPETADNMIAVCKECNLSKGDRDLYYWWIRIKQRDDDDIPRIAEGKYLKLIYNIHKTRGTLESTDLDGDGKLTVFDLGIIADRKPTAGQREAAINEETKYNARLAAHNSVHKRGNPASSRKKYLAQRRRTRPRRTSARPRSPDHGNNLIDKIKRSLGIS